MQTIWRDTIQTSIWVERVGPIQNTKKKATMALQTRDSNTISGILKQACYLLAE